MQAGKGEALVERVFDLDCGSTLVIGPTGVQRLVDVGDEMHEPGEGIGNLVIFRRRPQQANEALDLPVNLSPYGPSLIVDIDVVPVLVARSVGKAGKRRGAVVSPLVVEAWIVADVIGPRRGFGENLPGLDGTCLADPALMVGVAAKRLRNEIAVGGRELLPGDDRHQPVTGSVPRRGKG